MRIIAALLLFIAPLAHADRWVTDAVGSAQYSAPLGTPANPSFGKDGNGRPRCNVNLPGGAIAPFRCKLVTDPAPVPTPVPTPTPTPTPVPAPVSSWQGPQYVDVLSGPADGFTTIYGVGLGTSGSVTVGGAAATVVRWTDTAVTIHPGGSGDIVLNGAKVATYTAVAGAKVTLITTAAGIQACIDAANPGDQCVIRGGTYSPVHPQYGSFFSVHHKGGAANAHISIVGYPGEVVLFSRTSQTRGFHFYASAGHLTIANLHLDAKRAATSVGNSGEDCPTDIRLVANEVMNYWGGDGGGDAAISGSGTNYKWLGNYVHDNGGSKLYHALYFDARCANAGNSEIAYNRVERQTGGRGIQIFGDSNRPLITNIVVHHNTFADVGLNCILFGDRTGVGMVAHHNIATRCSHPDYRNKSGNPNSEGTSGSCLRFNSSSLQVSATNNTFTACDVDGDADSAGIVFQAAGSAVVRDNIIVAKKYANGSPAGTVSGNVWFGGGAPPAYDTAPLNVDPRLDSNFKATNPAVSGKGAL